MFHLTDSLHNGVCELCIFSPCVIQRIRKTNYYHSQIFQVIDYLHEVKSLVFFLISIYISKAAKPPRIFEFIYVKMLFY